MSRDDDDREANYLLPPIEECSQPSNLCPPLPSSYLYCSYPSPSLCIHNSYTLYILLPTLLAVSATLPLSLQCSSPFSAATDLPSPQSLLCIHTSHNAFYLFVQCTALTSLQQNSIWKSGYSKKSNLKFGTFS